MVGRLYESNTCIESYKEARSIELNDKREKTNGLPKRNGRNHCVAGWEPSSRARSLDRKDETHQEEQLSSNNPPPIRSSLPTTGTHASTSPLPAKTSGIGMVPIHNYGRRNLDGG